MVFGQIVIVLLLFILMRLYSLLPMMILCLLTISLIAVSAILNLILPRISRINVDSVEFLIRWRKAVARNRYLKRKHLGTRPLAFYAGLLRVTFFMFDRSTQLNFSIGCFDQLINLMIAFPIEDIKELFALK
jgi:hypothetical protein